VFAVNEGGMASHGGMIGLVLACVLYAHKTGVSRLYLFDLVALCGPVGIFFGRLANFVNGELVGRPAGPEVTWAVKFPQDIFQWSSDTQKLVSLTTVVEKVGITKDQWLEWIDKIRIDANSRHAINSALEKIVDGIQNGNTAAKEAIAPLLEARHPSQLYGALGEGLILFLVLFLLWRRPRKPGVIGAVFVIVYAIVRIVDEQFRMPDAHIGYQWLGLTRGQWLSTVMFLIGLMLLFLWGRRDSLTIPGWGKAPSVKIHRRS
jgi:phosphatidylglycerol:prolipoprotein diacylglycerol transferase